MFIAAYNATDNAVVVGADGETLGAHEWGVADTSVVTDLAESGAVHLYPQIEDGPGQNRDAVRAAEDAARKNELAQSEDDASDGDESEND